MDRDNRSVDMTVQTVQPPQIVPTHRRRPSVPIQALWLIAFSVFFLLVRIPQFTAQWDGEDGNGHHGAMLMGLAAPNEMIYARIGGDAHFFVGLAEHPGPPYILFGLIGKLARTVVPLQTLHGQTLIFALKAIVTLLQLSIFLAFLCLAFRYAHTKIPILWLWVISLTPVALYSSNEVQTDSSTGLLFVALFFMGAIIAQSAETRPTVRLLALLAGGFAAGLGKSEWTFCFAAALVLTALAHPLIRLIFSRRLKIDPIVQKHDTIHVVFAAAIGLTLGNIISYLTDPMDYAGGWKLLSRMIFQASILSGDTSKWWNNLRDELPYVFFHFVVDASILVQLIRRPQVYSATLLLAIASANTLFFAYIFSSWGHFPRYFAPAFIGLGACFLALLIKMPSQDSRNWTVTATIVLVALQSLYYQRTTHYWQLWRGNTDIPAWVSKYANDPGHCVLVVDYSFLLDRPDVEFVNAPNGRDFVDRYLTKVGRSACPS